MARPVIAPAFCQRAWVVRDLAAAERFLPETMIISRFMAMDNLAARDTEIERIQPVSGCTIVQDSLDRHGDTAAGHDLRRQLKAEEF